MDEQAATTDPYVDVEEEGEDGAIAGMMSGAGNMRAGMVLMTHGTGMIRKPLLKQNQWEKLHLVPRVTSHGVATGGANLGLTTMRSHGMPTMGNHGKMTSHGMPSNNGLRDIHQNRST